MGRNDAKVTEELFGFLIGHQVDGIILASSQQDAGTMIQKFVPRLPTVLLGTPALVSGDEVNSVCIDNLAGGRLAAGASGWSSATVTLSIWATAPTA